MARYRVLKTSGRYGGYYLQRRAWFAWCYLWADSEGDPVQGFKTLEEALAALDGWIGGQVAWDSRPVVAWEGRR